MFVALSLFVTIVIVALVENQRINREVNIDYSEYPDYDPAWLQEFEEYDDDDEYDDEGITNAWTSYWERASDPTEPTLDTDRVAGTEFKDRPDGGNGVLLVAWDQSRVRGIEAIKELKRQCEHGLKASKDAYDAVRRGSIVFVPGNFDQARLNMAGWECVVYNDTPTPAPAGVTLFGAPNAEGSPNGVHAIRALYPVIRDNTPEEKRFSLLKDAKDILEKVRNGERHHLPYNVTQEQVEDLRQAGWLVE